MRNYFDISGRAMTAGVLAYDCARAAEKMGDPNFCGGDNAAWKEGPFLSSPANMPEIERSHPYCLRASEDLAATCEIVMGCDGLLETKGGLSLPLPPANSRGSRVEPVIAKLVMIEQFELWKQFLKRIDGPYNRKKSKEWRGKAKPETLCAVESVTRRRNELTHDPSSRPATIKEAVEYFQKLRLLATQLHKHART